MDNCQKTVDTAQVMQSYFVNFKRLNDGLKSSEIQKALGPSFAKNLTTLIQNIDSDMSNVFKAIPSPLKVQVGDLFKFLNEIHLFIMREALSKNTTSFFAVFLILVSMWNFSAAKNRQLEDKIAFMNNTLNSHLTINEAIETLKIMIKRCEVIMKFSPPAFELNDAYFKALNDRIHKEMEETNETNKPVVEPVKDSQNTSCNPA